jgi:hypothetical protein
VLSYLKLSIFAQNWATLLKIEQNSSQTKYSCLKVRTVVQSRALLLKTEHSCSKLSNIVQKLSKMSKVTQKPSKILLKIYFKKLNYFIHNKLLQRTK